MNNELQAILKDGRIKFLIKFFSEKNDSFCWSQYGKI